MAGGVPTAEGGTRRTNDRRKAIPVSKKMEAAKETFEMKVGQVLFLVHFVESAVLN
jgi:hypothetical protein